MKSITNQIKIDALIGDKILDHLIYQKMHKIMPKTNVGELHSIRTSVTSNQYLAYIGNNYILKDSFKEWDKLSIHNKGTLIEAFVKRLYDLNNLNLLDKLITDLFILHAIQMQYKYGFLYNRIQNFPVNILYENIRWGVKLTKNIVICQQSCILKEGKSVNTQTQIQTRDISIQVEPKTISFTKIIKIILTSQLKLFFCR